MSYKSPVEIWLDDFMNKITTQIQENNEMQIMATINQYVSVDKEELIKALQYDRQQYEKGYADAKAEYQRPQGEWVEHYSKAMSEKGYFLCSRCKCGFQRFERGIRHSDLPWIDGQKYELHCIDNFCPNCGADMRGTE